MIVTRRVPFNVRVPRNLDADSLIPPTFRTDRRSKIKDQMYYILSALIPGPLDKHLQDDLDTKGFITLNADLLNKMLHEDYSKTISYLVEGKVITVDKKYVPGEKSRGYRLHPDYVNDPVFKTITNKGICDRYFEYWDAEEKEQEKRLKKIPHLTKWINKDSIRIDRDGAHDFIVGYRAGMIRQWESAEFSSSRKSFEARLRILNRTQYQKSVVNSIHEGTFDHKRDSAGRLYTPVTALKSQLRSFLSLEGESIASVDIKSSQPYLLNVLLESDFWLTTPNPKITLYKSYYECYKFLQDEGFLKEIQRHVKTYEERNYQREQSQKYKHIKWEEDFYAMIQGRVEQSSSAISTKKYYRDRTAVKQTMMLLLYDLYTKKCPPYYPIFKSLYPLEVQLMNLIKNGGKGVFPKIMQNIEAKIILEVVTKNIANADSKIPMLTIHDNIISTRKHITMVEMELKKVLTDIVGVVPGLKVEAISKEDVLSSIDNIVINDWNELYQNVVKNENEPVWLPSNNIVPDEVPLLYKMPTIKGRKVLRTVYVDPNPDPEEEQKQQDYIWGERMREEEDRKSEKK